MKRSKSVWMDKFQLAWISAAEGEKFASKIKEMKNILDTVTPEEITETNVLLIKKTRVKV